MIFYYLAEGELIEAERVAVDEDGKVLGREQRALTARAGEFPLFGTHWLMDCRARAALVPQGKH